MSDQQRSGEVNADQAATAEVGGAERDDTFVEPVHPMSAPGGPPPGAPTASPPWLTAADPSLADEPVVVVPDIPRIDRDPQVPPPENLADPMM